MNIVGTQLKKTYLKKTIFQNLNFEIDNCDRIGISGHNGSGKSTLLKIMAGYITPTSGNLIFSLDNHLIPSDKVFQYISYAAPYMDIPTDFSLFELFDFHFAIKKRYQLLSNESINSIVNLPTNILLHQFSSGMLQRVKLILAFFTDSKLLILDEPTETLDKHGFELYQLLLKNYAENRTIIIASNKTSDFIDCKEIIDISQYQ